MKSTSLDLDGGVRQTHEDLFPAKRPKDSMEEDPISCPPKRLTMIPPKYKLKEERRKVLKMSINKLKKIDDPETWLCRSVLINNTMRKLQKEARDEKMQKQMNMYSKTYFLGDECQLNNNNEDCVYQRDENKRSEEAEPLANGVPLNEDVVEKIPSIKRCASRKRSLDEDGPNLLMIPDSSKEEPQKPDDDMEDCDVHDVLSQLYMPPTPRLLTSIDSDTDDEDLSIVDMESGFVERKEPAAKKLKMDDTFLCVEKLVSSDRTFSGREDEEDIELEDEEDINRRLSQSLGGYRKNEVPNSYQKEDFYQEPPRLPSDPCDPMYSCGHTSLFNDIHSVTFHNLIASLET